LSPERSFDFRIVCQPAILCRFVTNIILTTKIKPNDGLDDLETQHLAYTLAKRYRCCGCNSFECFNTSQNTDKTINKFTVFLEPDLNLYLLFFHLVLAQLLWFWCSFICVLVNPKYLYNMSIFIVAFKLLELACTVFPKL
jgi:hypothetical protein